MSLRQFIADVMELPKAINAVNEIIGGEGMSRCPLCGSKDCCGGYYQEVQDVLREALEGAKWAMESYICPQLLEKMDEYQDVVKAIRKARGEE